MASEAGKGDTPRPIVDRKKFEESWERTFGKKCPEGLCENRKQCWEPCGHLGYDEKYAIISGIRIDLGK